MSPKKKEARSCAGGNLLHERDSQTSTRDPVGPPDGVLALIGGKVAMSGARCMLTHTRMLRGR